MMQRAFARRVQAGILRRLPTSQSKIHRAAPSHYGTHSMSPSTFGLKTLYSGKGLADVDIVAVHGLGANPNRTWTYRQDVASKSSTADSSGVESNNRETMWLKDLLPQQVPMSRIMTFNYASEWLRDAPRESMRPLASRLLANIDDVRQEREYLGKPERPIIFIGHSFGGLVIEEALAIAKHDQNFHHILKATYGVVFLGTPHRGADIASWGDTLATCAAAFGLGPDTELLNILRKDSDRLREIFNDFAVLSNDMGLHLICFYELYPTKISYRGGVFQHLVSTTTVVVDRFSATIDGHRHYGLNADHCTMNKYESKDDGNFKLVAYKLRELVTHAPRAIRERFDRREENRPEELADRMYFVVPHAQNKNFVPRPSVDQKLQTLLEVYPQKDAQVRIALYGLEGSGKTQHALNFAYQQKEYQSVFWVNGITESTFEEAYTEIGKRCGLFSDEIIRTEDQLCVIVREWLESPKSGKWVLIVDGVDDLSDAVLRHCNEKLPESRGTIIFTSANTNVIGNLVPLGLGLEIGAMSGPTAEAMFRTIAGQPEIQSDELAPLLELLGYLPLAIAHAAAFVRENHLSIRNYINAFQGPDDGLKERLLSEPTKWTPQSVLRTWDINFQYIRNQDQRASKLIKLMSQLSQEVSRQILRSPRLKEFGLEDDIAFDKCMGLLVSYALVIPIHARDSYRLHPLVALRTRQNIQDRLLFQRMAIDIVTDMFPDDQYGTGYAIQCAGLISHAENILSWVKSVDALASEHQLLSRKVDTYRNFLNDNYLNRWADWGFITSSNIQAEEKANEK